jgi:hypothetical protein
LTTLQRSPQIAGPGRVSQADRLTRAWQRGPGQDASHLFQVISRRYEHGSIVLTTNRGIASWGEIFGEPTVVAAILDRLLHHASAFPRTAD